MANYLFIHQNFPGQYRHLAPALANQSGNRVIGIRIGEDVRWQGVDVRGYAVQAPAEATTHPWLADLHPKLIRAEAVARKAIALKDSGFTPDAIIAHPGWGETLLLREEIGRAHV